MLACMASLARAILSPHHSVISFLVYSDNVTPPPSSSNTRVGHEKLSYNTDKSNIYCLHCDNVRSHYQSGVILNVLQIQDEEVAVH